MATFTYDHSIESPAVNISHIFGFSHQGKHLALADGIARRVYIIDTDLQEGNCIPTVVSPTSLVWDPVEAQQFIVGFRNGRFSLCSFRGAEVSETRFDALEDRGAVQSLALTADGLTLAVAISHGGVFIFNRKSYGDLFKLIINATSEYNFRSVIQHDQPNPRSLCFTTNGTLFISYEQHGVLSIPPVRWGSSETATTTSISGHIERGELSLLRAVTSSDDRNYPQGLYNFWVYCAHPQGDGDVTPLLFVDRGTSVLHIDPRGTVFISDSITRNPRQQLDDDGVFGHHNGVPIYHEGGGNGILHVAHFANDKGQWVVTARSGGNGSIKFWYADANGKIIRRKLSRKAIYTIIIIVFLAFALGLFAKRRNDLGEGVNHLIMHYRCAIAEYHEEVTTRVDRLRGEVVAVMDDALKVLQPFIGE